MAKSHKSVVNVILVGGLKTLTRYRAPDKGPHRVEQWNSKNENWNEQWREEEERHAARRRRATADDHRRSAHQQSEHQRPRVAHEQLRRMEIVA